MAILHAENLPYSVKAQSRLPHYMHYLLLPSSEKTKWLMGLARLDPFFHEITDKLEAYGCQVNHRFYGHSGVYHTQQIKLAAGVDASDDAIAKAIETLRETGKLKPKFSFSSRYGGAQMAHYFLHELVHFWQDINGLFFAPVLQEGKPPSILDAESQVMVTCFCEAMAEIEALRASWRLKEAGYDVAWQGALSSLDWRKHARAYAADIANMPEAEAARRAFDRWNKSHHRQYYEKRALKTHKERLKLLPVQGDQNIKTCFKYIIGDELLEKLPKEKRLVYLTA